MLRNHRLWLSVLAAEIIFLNLLFWFLWNQNAQLQQPPYPNVELLDPISIGELEAHHKAAVARRDAETWRQLAVIYTVYGFFPEADVCCRHAAEMAPNKFEVRFWWGVISDRLGKVDQAVEQFNLALELVPPAEQGQCAYHLGRNYLRNENIEQAEKAFRLGAQTYEHAKYSLTKLLVEQTRHDEAQPIIAELLSKYPNSLRILQLAAKVAEAKGNLLAAEEFIDRSERGIENFHSDELAFSLIGLANQYGRQQAVMAAANFGKQGNYQQALKEYKRINQIEWSRKLAWNISLMELELGNLKQGISEIEDLIQQDGETAQRLDVLGDAYLLLSKRNNDPALEQKAVENWLAVTDYADVRDVYSKLADYYQRQGGETQFKHYRMLHLQTVGIRAFRNNNLAAAQQAFFEAIQLNPELDHSWYYLGELANADKKTEQAIQAYEKCLDINPHHGRAAAKLALLNNATASDTPLQDTSAKPAQDEAT